MIDQTSFVLNFPLERPHCGIPLTTKDGITDIRLDTAKLPTGPVFYFELE